MKVHVRKMYSLAHHNLAFYDWGSVLNRGAPYAKTEV